MVPSCCATYSRRSGPNCSEVGFVEDSPASRLFPNEIGAVVEPVPDSGIVSGVLPPECAITSDADFAPVVVGLNVTEICAAAPGASATAVESLNESVNEPASVPVIVVPVTLIVGEPAAPWFTISTICDGALESCTDPNPSEAGVAASWFAVEATGTISIALMLGFSTPCTKSMSMLLS